MAVRPRSKWRLRTAQEGGLATLKMAAQTLSRWRLPEGHKMARRGTSSPQKALVLPPEADPASAFAAPSRVAFRPGDTGAGVGGAGGGRLASGSDGAASVAVAARRTVARAPDVARRHGGCGGAAAGPGLALRGLPPPPPPPRAPAASLSPAPSRLPRRWRRGSEPPGSPRGSGTSRRSCGGGTGCSARLSRRSSPSVSGARRGRG